MMMDLERILKTTCEFPCLWLKKEEDFLFSLLYIMLTSNQSAD